ncbi:MAG: hypothetical protein KKD29_06880 [Candidatus Omnitrophica bacterium]|nr:hypothetical protein [Candidatus Omnitrophota bacterium]MBU4488804.1 hypothetical protein [Candidatus Omnitrophota bacterium]MCG2705461.1 hypothetical protein [Candidatus Omnitrophota bacterium]
MKRYGILMVAGLFIFFSADYTLAADMKKLMEVGASQTEIAKSLRQETKSYDAVKKAINSGAIKEGMTADTIRKKYGGPIIEVYDKKRDITKWLYMPASSNHFGGEKLYIHIDSDNKVKGWELIEG